MPRMRVRKVKRKCNVLGCRCTDTYALTVTSEYGSSVVACKNCLAEALKCIEEGRIEGLPKVKATEESKIEPDIAEEPATEESKDESKAEKPKKNSSVKPKKDK